MQERVVDIATRDGKMNTYVFHPDGPGPHPVVIHYMDSVGVREELSDMCRRLATVGYYVLLPNLYYREVRCVDLEANRLRDPAYAEKLELMWTLNRSLTNTMIVEDTEAMLSFIDTDPVARSERRVFSSFFRKEEYKVPIYRRILVLFKLKSFDHHVADLAKAERISPAEAEKRVRRARENIPSQIKPDNIYVKIFKDMPKSDVEMVFPNTRV